MHPEFYLLKNQILKNNLNLNNIKPVIICGDFNIAFSELDVCHSIPASLEFIDEKELLPL